ncbi:MAG: hypothetical protein U5L11_07030 [Arhodomonas sp.]|nr:hypothetical protein [Arhodomonas sp.]
MAERTSRIPGFFELPRRTRLARVAEMAGLDDPTQAAAPRDPATSPAEVADSMIENVIGTFDVPLGIATNLIIDGEEVLVPMATEESSVVAAVSNAAASAGDSGGFHAAMSRPALTIAQVQLVDVPNPEFARLRILEHTR